MSGPKLVQVSQDLWEMPEPLGIFAGELLRRGRAYYQAFKLLSENDQPDLRFPTYFLLAHSFEVVLKSYLVAVGTPKKALNRKPLGHDIGSIYSECERNGLTVAHPLVRPLANQLTEINSDYDLRYPSGYHLPIAKPSECMPPCDALISAVSTTVGRAKAQAQLQYATDTRHLQGSKVRWCD